MNAFAGQRIGKAAGIADKKHALLGERGVLCAESEILAGNAINACCAKSNADPLQEPRAVELFG